MQAQWVCSRERRTALYKWSSIINQSNCPPSIHPVLSVSLSTLYMSYFVCVSVQLVYVIFCLCQCPPCICPILSVSLSPIYTSCFVCVTIHPVHVLFCLCQCPTGTCPILPVSVSTLYMSYFVCVTVHPVHVLFCLSLSTLYMSCFVCVTVHPVHVLFCLCQCPPWTCPVLFVSLSPIYTSCFVCVSIHRLYVLFSVTVDPLHVFACCGCGVRFDSSQSSEDLVIKLRRELERCVISNREKRSKVGELQQHNKRMQQDLTDLRQQLSDAQHTIHTMQVVTVNIRLIERKLEVLRAVSQYGYIR